MWNCLSGSNLRHLVWPQSLQKSERNAVFRRAGRVGQGGILPLEHVLARHENAKRKWWRTKAANNHRKEEWGTVRLWHISNFLREEEAAKVAEAEAKVAAPVSVATNPPKEERNSLVKAAEARAKAASISGVTGGLATFHCSLNPSPRAFPRVFGSFGYCYPWSLCFVWQLVDFDFDFFINTISHPLVIPVFQDTNVFYFQNFTITATSKLVLSCPRGWGGSRK